MRGQRTSRGMALLLVLGLSVLLLSAADAKDVMKERFFEPQMLNGRMTSGDRPIEAFALRGIKDSPPYRHDGRLLILED